MDNPVIRRPDLSMHELSLSIPCRPSTFSFSLSLSLYSILFFSFLFFSFPFLSLFSFSFFFRFFFALMSGTLKEVGRCVLSAALCLMHVVGSRDIRLRHWLHDSCPTRGRAHGRLIRSPRPRYPRSDSWFRNQQLEKQALDSVNSHCLGLTMDLGAP